MGGRAAKKIWQSWLINGAKKIGCKGEEGRRPTGAGLQMRGDLQ